LSLVLLEYIHLLFLFLHTALLHHTTELALSPTNIMSSTNAAPDSHISTTTALSYWNSCDPSVTGMLGGFPQVSRIDLQQSSTFLAKLRRASKAHPTSTPLTRIVDCGAGIGRITLGLLSTVATTTDIVEPVQKFTHEISHGDDFKALREQGKIGKIYNVGLESWTPEFEYDVIWIQWCLGQCTDEQVKALFLRIQKHLSPGGWIVLKENLSNHQLGEDVYDETDSSVTRTDDKFRALFADAGLKIVATELQRGFPKDLYPVRIYAAQPSPAT
jgi:protein N-terminal methyltransferase